MVAHADGCDELASLLRRVDSCIAEETDGGDVDFGEPVEIVSHDAGDAHAVVRDATARGEETDS
jgi:hypothetical protein